MKTAKSINDPKVSEAVRSHVSEFYAVLATKAAARAAQLLSVADTFNELGAVDLLAATTERYLIRAGAKATRYRFRLPG